jgi:branched-chain amino acid aminotransferase
MQNAIINVNGHILNSENAKVSVFDRGFLYGDSLYEVVRTYDGKPWGMDEHLERLLKSAELCQMKLGQTTDVYKQQILQTLKAFRSAHSSKEAYIRLIVTRGVGRIGFGLNCVLTPTQYVVIVQPLDPPTDAQFEKGYRMKISRRLRNDPRALDPAMKSGNYLNSLLAFLEATDNQTGEKFDDALLCNQEGHLTEGTTFNIFYVKRGIVVTPPLEIGILDGITRRETLQLCRETGIPAREVRFPRERLHEADEVFLTSTIKEVFPISQVDDRVISGGKPGPVTRKLRDGFREFVTRNLKGRQSA